MKLTQTMIELMFELSNIEGERHVQYFHGEGDILRNNLLKLFKETENPASHDIIINIMSEAGYPWFGKLAHSNNASIDNTFTTVACNLPVQNDVIGFVGIMSDEEFMDLLPANGHIH